jgi:hypothetical protein
MKLALARGIVELSRRGRAAARAEGTSPVVVREGKAPDEVRVRSARSVHAGLLAEAFGLSTKQRPQAHRPGRVKVDGEAVDELDVPRLHGSRERSCRPASAVSSASASDRSERKRLG